MLCDREAATGLALLIVPSLVGRLLLGEELTRRRCASCARGWHRPHWTWIACWPGPPLIGMLTYSALVTLYLASIGLTGEVTGVLLWPAVVLHMILTLLLTRAAVHNRRMTT